MDFRSQEADPVIPGTPPIDLVSAFDPVAIGEHLRKRFTPEAVKKHALIKAENAIKDYFHCGGTSDDLRTLFS